MHNGDCGLPSLRRPSETGVASEALPSPKSRGALRLRLEGALNLRKGSPEAPGGLWKKRAGQTQERRSGRSDEYGGLRPSGVGRLQIVLVV